MPHPGQPNQHPPHPGQAQPGYAPPPYGHAPQGHPHPGYGHAQPPGYGHAPPPAYPQQPGYPPPQAPSQNPFDSIGAPTNAWIPGALVSFFFPGIGLLLIGRPEHKSLAIKIFVGYVALVFGSIIFGILLSIVGLGFLWSILSLALMVAPIGSLIHTHDMTVKAYPHLGQPIFFKN